MDSRRRTEGSYPDLFPKDYPERLGVENDRVATWRTGAIPTGGEVWHIMRLALSVHGGMEVMLPENTRLDEGRE